MQLSVNNIGKHYNKQWLFRNISFSVQSGESIAILGKNGSGKSTLLQIIIGLIQASEGEVTIDDKVIENHHHFFSFTSPLMTPPLEFNIREIHDYYMKTGKTSMVFEEFIEWSAFTVQESKRPLRFFSSGMLQRLKTAYCLTADSEILLLDEPLSNMDKDGEKWYVNCIEKVINNHIVIVASNSEQEYQFTKRNIKL